jgi:clan AA aspartic protease
MSQRTATILPAEESVGHVWIPLTVRNQFDEHDASRGLLDRGAIRSVGPLDALADTGATELCLPQHLIEQLGLDPIEQTSVVTAAGRVVGTVYHGAVVQVGERWRPMACLALPGDVFPFLGAIAMQSLGIELDLRTETYRLLPDGYLRA